MLRKGKNTKKYKQINSIPVYEKVFSLKYLYGVIPTMGEYLFQMNQWLIAKT